MKAVLQRVKSARVAVGGHEKASIDKGFLLLVGIAREDTPDVVRAMARKISKLRVFEDEQGKMNLDINEIGGKILSISQFTLLGNTDKGNRPGFDPAAPPDEAKKLWEDLNEELKKRGIPVAEGEFGAKMEITLVNDGPVTFVLNRS
ncbi:MAG: D-tyrosyl-tRNA(Tyr) deacylase [Candidatus Omnitrophica bacterium]|nr:D-tyrosyl-tRNA(Tyr) deacylase [Candidatus Omnitrophota bacterium]